MHRGKKYKAAKAQIEKRTYGLDEAIALLKKTSPTKFDATCEVHMRLGLNPAKADQNIRGTVTFPHGTGQKVRVIVFATETNAKKAMQVGAVQAGAEELIEKIAKGWFDFDVVVAEPALMSKLGKIAKALGQKGLMPNPKAGTVSPTPEKVVAEILNGRIEYRLDKTSNIHNVFGKVSFDEAKLKENLETFLQAVRQARPASAKGNYIQNITVTTTMGPAIAISLDVVA